MTRGDDITVLCVDPENDCDATVATFERRANFSVFARNDAAGAIDAAEERAVDCVVAEYQLPDGTGFDVFESVRTRHPNAVCILFTDATYDAIDSDAFRDTVAEYLPKTTNNAHDRLVDLVRNAVINRTQVGFPLPPDEDDRLAAVAEYDVQSLAAIETFDRLSKLVARHFDVDVAFVGLVDEVEEEFIACHGAQWDTLAREDSICTYSILDDEVMVVENVQADPRFEHNQTLRELDIRSYAGANITNDDGQVVGQLCLTHDEPRSYSEGELTDLQLFADEVSEQLELRRRLDTDTSTSEVD